jgi:hypothetical protein
MACCLLLCVFLVLFPKGGIKVGVVPLTWGYLLIALTAPVALVLRLLSLPLRFRPLPLAVLALAVPFQLIVLYAVFVYGIENPPYFIATVTGLFVFPWLFLFVYAPFLPFVQGRTFARYLCFCIFAAAAWGILLFFLHPIINKFIEIPYLTVNAADYGLIERTKHIQRGIFFKLISTYNNGNVYGAATLIVLPLYRKLEPSRWRRLTVIAALLLTLSRTVWAGLIFAELIPFGVQLWRQARTFPIFRFAALGKRLLIIATTVVLVGGSMLFIGFGEDRLAFLFDPAAGGRSSEVALHGITWLPNQPVPAFNEVIYGSAIQHFGILGLLAFLLILFGPFLLLLWDRSALRSPLRRAALEGLLIYAFIGFSDGALDLIPVMAFYWFAYMIYVFGWPGVPDFAPGQARLASVAVRPGTLPAFTANSGDLPA